MYNAHTIVGWLFIAAVFEMALILAENPDEVAAILRHHEVVPDVIANEPQKLLHIRYNDIAADKGVELTPTLVQQQPKLEWDSEDSTYYTLIMTDPDAPSRAEPKFREFNHWLVGNILGNDIGSGTVIRAYIGSGPPKGSGLHRYVFLLYKQPGLLQFDEPLVTNNSRRDRPKFSTANFAKKYDLGVPLAVNFYQAQWDDYVPILHRQLSEA